MAHATQEILQLRRQGTGKGQWLATSRMGKCDSGGVKKVPGQRQRWLRLLSFARREKLAGGAVEGVSHHGMTEGCEVDADLVGAASINCQVEQAELAERRLDAVAYFVVSDGLAAAAAPRS